MSTDAEPTSAVAETQAVPRITRQRTALADTLSTLDDFRSAQELHDLLRSSGNRVGLSTVYRTLQTMVDAGTVDVVKRADGESVYRRCATETHHHHLVCRQCGRAVEVEQPDIERWTTEIAARHGFSHVSHTIEIFGVCPDHS